MGQIGGDRVRLAKAAAEEVQGRVKLDVSGV